MITQFHIIFVYPTNLTILSSITRETVHSLNLNEIVARGSIFDPYQSLVLLFGQKDQIRYSGLANEGKDAGMQHLKRGNLE